MKKVGPVRVGSLRASKEIGHIIKTQNEQLEQPTRFVLLPYVIVAMTNQGAICTYADQISVLPAEILQLDVANVEYSPICT